MRGSIICPISHPLMQGRLFSYTDTQLIRLGGPNFHEIPVNRPVVPVHNNQRDGYMRQQINKGRTSYHPNSLGGGCPYQAGMKEGGFTSYAEKIDAKKIRERSRSFFDHFSQAKLFFNSQSVPEQQHIIDALSFELGKVQTKAIRERMLGLLSLVEKKLAAGVAHNLGVKVPEPELPLNKSVPADAAPDAYESIISEPKPATSAALSMANTVKDSIKTRTIAILIADGVNTDSVIAMQDALKEEGAMVDIIAPHLGTISGQKKEIIPVNQRFLTAASVLYDAVYIPGGETSVATLETDPDVIHFLNEAYRHCKAIAADEDAIKVLSATYFGSKVVKESSKKPKEEGIIVSAAIETVIKAFIEAIASHRFWDREKPEKFPPDKYFFTGEK